MNFSRKWVGRFKESELSLVLVVLIADGIFLLAIREKDPLFIPIWWAALVSFLIYVMFTSVHILDTDEMLRSRFLGTLLRTYVTGTYAEIKDRKGKTMGEYPQAEPGLFGLDIVLLLYPFWRGEKWPTLTARLRIHSQDAFAKDNVPVSLDTTLLLSLTPDVSRLTVRVTGQDDTIDLTEECEIKDNLWTQEKPTEHVHEANRLSEILLNRFQNTVLEAMRLVASEFTFQELRGDLKRFEKRVLEYLSRPESILSQAGILDETDLNLLGTAAAAVDFNVERLSVDPDLRTAMSKPATARLELEAAKLAGKGEGERLKEMSRESGITAEDLYRGEVLKKVGALDVVVVDDNAASVVQGLFRQVTKPKKSGGPPPAASP